jgi:hypothetical protein
MSGFINVYKDNPVEGIKKAELALSEDVFHFVTIDNGGVRQEVKITWDELKQQPDSSDFDRWVWNHRGVWEGPYNLHARTVQTKETAQEYVMRNGLNLVLHIIIRPGDMSFRDAVIFINLPPKSKFDSNVPYAKPKRTFTSGKKAYHPNLELKIQETFKEGDSVIVATLDKPANTTLYVEADGGYVPRKVEMKKGVATFSFTPMGRAASKRTIKAGFKHWTNLATLTIE